MKNYDADHYEDDNFEDEDDSSFSSSAWLLEGITGSRYGNLELKNERLVFVVFSEEGERRLFDVPLSELKDIVFPWYYFGGGVKFRIGADKYRLSFVEPNNTAAHPDIGSGRQAGKVWKSLLQKV